ncbi:aldehyde dehydrogenase family protein [Haloarcula onubensis]|uniref:Aldehyde dehydrogenase family protein n=1 Tax=Haloarcula onubensis TaxID=2950539 RepID=A0ABU2FPR2_9EURY|nr:aldehyde dehydrogenase family protein [Halomicroarcula sp. S3CR25-11]MDS0282745.1 aldehyde dehydrogenase family protein [Halomicroarcula sp. S3CR25-11]
MSQEVATRLDKQMLIGGEWVDADDRTDVAHPYDGEVVGSVPLASEQQVVDAIDAAEAAFEAASLSAYQRYELLSETARQVETRADDIARILTSEQGKPLSEARGEVDRAVQTLDLSAEQAKRMFGEYVPMDAQKGFARDHCFTQREPLGVVAAITPFNFPLNLMVHKVGPALAAGNAVVGKPATNTPLTSIALFECLDDAADEIDADVPDGLVNVVTGSGSATGDVILEHDAVEAISFTGSTAVGKYIANNSGMKEVTLELGGNDPTIIWDDTDIEEAAAQVVGGACSNAGQVCNSVERVLVPDHIEGEVVDALVDAAESLTVGDPFDDGTDVASMVDDSQFEDVVDIFEATVDAGATVECGGNYGGDLGPRTFEPTVLSGVDPEMPAAAEETFGPLVPVITVSDFEAAIDEANNTNYGLEAGLFTQDIDRAKRAADEIDAGGVNINTVSGFRADHMPYGGFKDSGVGKEGIKYAVEHFSREKLVGFHQGFNA